MSAGRNKASRPPPRSDRIRRIDGGFAFVPNRFLRDGFFTSLTTLTGMKKHVVVLEQAGLVSTEKVGRVRTCKLGPRRLEEETAWIEKYRQLWAARFDELDAVVDELKQKEKLSGRKKR
jgi:hypothetical protein